MLLKSTTGAVAEYWPMPASRKNNGIPTKKSITVYGIRNDPATRKGGPL